MARLLSIFLVLTVALGGLSATATAQSGTDAFEGGISSRRHTAWGTAEDAPADIWALAQSADGYLWLGTGSGLYRFDGMEFTPVPLGQAPNRSANITALLITPDGCLWIGYYSGGSSTMCGDAVRHYGPEQGAPGGMVFNFTQDATGQVWMATSRGLARFQDGRWNTVGPEYGYPVRRAEWVLTDQSGTLWVATGQTIVRRRSGLETFEATPLASGKNAVIVQAPDGSIWSSDLTHGTRIIAGTPIRPLDHMTALELSRRPAKRLMFSKTGVLWATDAHKGGVFSLETHAGQAKLDHFGAKDGLTSQDAVPLMEDAEANVWVGSNLGLNSFRWKNIHSVELPGAQKPTLYDWVYSQDRELIVKTREWLYSVSTAVSTKLPQALPSRSSLIERRGDSWWLLFDKTLTILEHGRERHFPLPQDRSYADVLAVAFAPSGTMFISLDGAGLFQLDAGTWTKIAFDGQAPTALNVAPEGLWAGGNKNTVALIRADGRAQYFGPLDGIKVGWIGAMARAREGIVLIGDDGIAVQSAGRFRSIPGDRFGEPTAVTGAVVDGQQALWLNSIRGVWRIPLGELYGFKDRPARSINYQQLATQDGAPGVAIQSSFLPTAWAGKDDTVWFATNGGLAWINPSSMRYNQRPPRVSVLGVSSQEGFIPALGSAALPKGTTNIDIRYTATSLSVPKRVLFRTRLIGADTEWSAASNQRQVSYANLRPGHYTFQVLAANNDGVWSQQPASFSFDIPPTFFQSKWFFITCLIASVALVLFFYFYQMRQMAHAIKIRLHERFEERDRIARELHDTLIQGFQGLVLRFDAIHRQIPMGLADVRRDMEDAISRAEEVISEGRDRVGDIRVDSGQPHDLAQALSHIQDEIALETQAHLEVQTNPPRPISSIARDEVYRIGREGILNAFRHSHATLISVQLDYRDDGLMLRVEDNGLGINPQLAKDGARPGHWGLPGMRERAKRLSATLTIVGGQGTTISLWVPASACYPKKSLLGHLLSGWLRKKR